MYYDSRSEKRQLIKWALEDEYKKACRNVEIQEGFLHRAKALIKNINKTKIRILQQSDPNALRTGKYILGECTNYFIQGRFSNEYLYNNMRG